MGQTLKWIFGYKVYALSDTEDLDRFSNEYFEMHVLDFAKPAFVVGSLITIIAPLMSLLV